VGKSQKEVVANFEKGPAVCGTCACALGHGLAAGIAPLAPLAEVTFQWSFWQSYSEQFVDGDRQWQWCFSDAWGDFDNSHRGAAARIRYLLANGVPLGFGYFDEESVDEAGEWMELYMPFVKKN
jgi:hypothetical protein